MKKFKMSAALCLLLSLLMLFSACAPRTLPTPRELPAQEPAYGESYTPLPVPIVSAPGHLPSTLAAEIPLPISLASVEWGGGDGPLYSIAPAISFGMANLSATPTPQFDLRISQTFRVTRPARANNYRITTNLAAYFITGTSNPNAPLFFGNQEVQRLGTQGTWGVLVQLNIGENAFTARQGDETTNIVITRRAVPGVVPITAIVQNSMFPATQGGVRAGGTIPVEAIAPAGGTVTASFGGQSVTLNQVAAANPGTPATFRGQLPVGRDFPAGVTTRAGRISYSLTFNGVSTSYQSSGYMFVAGEGSHIAMRVTAYLGIVNTAPTQGSIRELLKTGAADFVYSQTNTHFRLFSGGYISIAHAEIITGEVRIGNHLSAVQSFFTERRETYSFIGQNRPAYRTSMSDGVFSITFFNTVGTPGIDVSRSRMFSSASATVNNNNSVTYSFRLREGAPWWGYQIFFDGTNTVLRFQYRPRLSGDAARPLTGVTIMLDSGHGGTDPGALGIAAGMGPDENLLNLANTFALRDELVSLGAEVLLTRTRLDQTVSLDQRLQAFERSGADMFISIHHNSLLESTNANTVQGAESFFHHPMSYRLSRNMLDTFTTTLGRNRRQSNQSTFRVTLLPKAPSILFELGFMTHPVEYERLSDPAVIQQQARAMAQGVIATLR